jgi:hypothetical protein
VFHQREEREKEPEHSREDCFLSVWLACGGTSAPQMGLRDSPAPLKYCLSRWAGPAEAAGKYTFPSKDKQLNYFTNLFLEQDQGKKKNHTICKTFYLVSLERH